MSLKKITEVAQADSVLSDAMLLIIQPVQSNGETTDTLLLASINAIVAALKNAGINNGSAANGGGGAGTDSNAVHYTADSGKTYLEKRQARENVNADVKKLVINVSTSGSPITADKTYIDINNALVEGTLCVVIDDIYTYYLVDFDDVLSVVYFICPMYSNSTGRMTVRTLRVNSSDQWTLYTGEYGQAENKIADSSSSSITIALAADNTIYEYGELSALTVTAIPASGDFIIRFTSGSTPTTTNFPASMVFPEAFAAEANTRYEISVSNGYALAAGWAVSV